MPDPRLELARELERMDEAVAATLDELDELAREVEAVRLDAQELEASTVRLPEERSVAEAALREAEQARDRAAGDLEQAEAAAAAAQDEESERESRRTLVRARDRLHVAERKADEARAGVERLAQRTEALAAERSPLERRARELAEAVRRRPRLADEVPDVPAAGFAGAAEWASRARASLFVARGQLTAERDAVIRQANELAAAVVGEPLTAATTAIVARRVERELNPSE
jgi:hypothetical protein